MPWLNQLNQDALKQASNKKETRIKMEIVQLLTTVVAKYRKLVTVARMTVTLMSSITMPAVFKKSILRNLTYVLR